MKHTVLLGLAKLLEKEAKAARPEVEAGEYELDAIVTLHLSGTLDVAEDQQYTPTVDMPWKTVLALFVRFAGVTRETALTHLEHAMAQALRKGDNAAELLSAVADLDEAVERVQQTLDTLPRKTRRGSVSAAELDLVEVTPAKRRRAATAA
jgi:uncharacterized protein YoxC